MKQISILILGTVCLLCFSIFSNAQTRIYKQMMEDTRYNFYEVVDSANAYFDKYGRTKGSGWKGFARWKNENESKFYPTGVRTATDFYHVSKAYQEVLSEQGLKTKTSFDNGWNELGPWDANNVTSHYSPGIGRIETFWVNPNNNQHLFLGSRSGGFWKTTDGGTTWKNTTDFLVASGVFTLAVNPFNFDEVLISVQHGGLGYTHGIYRSTDGGETWNITKFEPQNLNWGGLGDNERIYVIKYHPTIQNRVYVGSTKGLFYSEDNLDSWTQSFNGRPTDIEFHTSKDSVIYVFNNNGTDRNHVKTSRDLGKTFTNSNVIADNNNAKGYLSLTTANDKNVYFASNNGVWKSNDEGQNFTFLSNPEENCQGFAISDIDSTHMIYGYVDAQSSRDGGLNFAKATKWAVQDDAYIHADIRALECLDGVFYVGTDGYLAKSTDWGKTWTILNDGTAVREFYAVGVSQGDARVHMAGSQDNGTSILNAEGWIEWNGGDGMEAIVNSLNRDLMIGSWQYGNRNVTNNGGLSRRAVDNPEKGSYSEADWEAPLLLDPENGMRVIHCGENMYESLDFGYNWQQIGSPGVGLIREGAISFTNSDVMCVARNSNIRLTEDGGAIWTLIKNNLPGYSITDIAFHPKNDSILLVTYNRYQNDGNKIFISYDRGANWENITFNLNNMPLRTVAVDHSDSSYIYVGSEIGVYYKSLKGTEWTLYNNNLPNVTVKDLEIHFGSNTLKAATWGRGLYEYTLVGRNNHPSIEQVNISQPKGPKVSVYQYITAKISNDENLKSATLYWSKNQTTLDSSINLSSEGNGIWKSDKPIPSGALNDRLFFKVRAESQDGKRSETDRFNYNTIPYVYCDAIGSPGTGSDYITGVSLNRKTKTSGQDYYGEFIATTFDLEKGGTYEVEVTMNYHFAGSDSVSAWIDYNNNTDFEESERLVFGRLNNNHIAIASFTLPQDALVGEKVRLRVKSTYNNAAPGPCGEETGEVEDYSILINNRASVHSENLKFSLSPNPSNGSFTIDLKESFIEEVSIMDLTGKKVFEQYNVGNNPTIETNLSAGVYILNIKSKEGIGSQKLIIE